MRAQRDRACQYGDYPCVGSWIFLLPSIAGFAEWPDLVKRGKEGANIIDLGCGLGQDLRLLANHIYNTDNMYASDKSTELWELGYDLFRDKSKMHAQFIKADFLDNPPSPKLEQLRGKMDIIIANQFLHLFDYFDQYQALKQIVGLSRVGTTLIGYQQGNKIGQEIETPWANMWFHNEASWHRAWAAIQASTATVWEVKVQLVELTEWGMEKEDFEWMPPGKKGLNFVVTRLE